MIQQNNAGELDLLRQWYEQILKYIGESGLRNLSEYKDAFGETPFKKFTDITRSKEPIKPFSYSDFKHGDEFNFISMDLMYVIAILELLLPYINDPDKENNSYHQRWEDHLYLRYSGFGFEIIYNYWDRIGDILTMFFQTGLKGDVYLSRVFNNFPVNYKSDTFYQLYDLFKTHVEPIINDRHDVVHTFGLKAKHFWGFMEKSGDQAELKKLQDEKNNYPNIFREQLEWFCVGFTLTMQLISELPNKPIPPHN